MMENSVSARSRFVAAAGAVILVITTAFAAPAFAGGSDAPTPYEVTPAGVTLPGGDVFEAHGHINIKTDSGNRNVHFDPNNQHFGGQWIGKNHIPWTAFSLPAEFCVEWVQIHGYNEHFGEGGQEPVCIEVDKPEGSTAKWLPVTSVTCDVATFKHTEFFSTVTKNLATAYEYQVTVNGVVGEVASYTPNTVIEIPFTDREVVNNVAVTLWAQTFARQQLGQIQLKSEPCIEEPPAEEPPVEEPPIEEPPVEEPPIEEPVVPTVDEPKVPTPPHAVETAVKGY